MLDGSTLFVIIATFLLAGTVKGVTGLGLPTISLALLTVAIDLPSAMALLLVPSLATNLWQALVGGSSKVVLQRLWPFMSMATVTVWLGATALTRVDLSLLSVLLGGLLVVYASISLSGLSITIATRHERWVGPLFGVVNGVLTGMTGSFVVPGVMYLQAIALSRGAMIQAMGMLFTLSTLALAMALQGNKLLTVEQGMLSVIALLPAIIGMMAGQRIRQNLSEQLFRRILFASLFALGLYIIFSRLGD